MMAPMIASSVVASWFTGGGSAPAPVIVQAPAAKPAAKPAPAKPAPTATPTKPPGRLLSSDTLNIQALAQPTEDTQSQTEAVDYDKFSNLAKVIEICEKCVNHR